MEAKYKKTNTKKRISLFTPFLTIIGIGVFFLYFAFYDKSWDFSWSEIRENIKDSIKIAKVEGITSGVGGNGISTQNEVNRRKWIMENATEKELLNLIEYPNETIKAIAYEGLLRRKEFVNKTELTLKAINDTVYRVDYQSGCIGSYRRIGEYLVQDVLMLDEKIPPSPYMKKIEFEFSKYDKIKILSLYRNYLDIEF